MRPVEIGEVLKRTLAKVIPRAGEAQVKEVCRILKICERFESGIEGGIHVM